MPADPNETRTQNIDPPRTDPWDAGLAAAFGPDLTPGGWSQPPLLRDDPSDNTPIVQPSSPEMPRAAGERYQFLGEIGRGGMGVVLKGRDPDLGRDLAFKVLKAELAGRPAAVQRFVEEAQVGGQLQHPGVVPVYEVGRFADGRPYFSMKLVKGRTLADLLAEFWSGHGATGPQPAGGSPPAAAIGRATFVRHFLQVCQTVAYAHAKGVIHRDLKPANVMIGAFGEVLVVDWGLAKVLPRGGVADEERASRGRERERPEDGTVIRTDRAGPGSETAAGSVLGTPAFSSPEQAAGEVGKVDERADVFGLGAVLCAILTGHPPYRADTAEAVRLMAVRGELGPAFARLDACGADAELVDICKRCLAADRDARPRAAGEVAAAVADHLAGVEDRAKRAELDRAAAAAEAREQRKRRRVQLALAVSLALLVSGGLAFAWWQDRQATARRAEVADRDRDERGRLARNAEAVAGLLDRCEEALRADDADRAEVALAEADRRLSEGEDEGGGRAADRAARCRADLAVLRDLDAADAFRWTVPGGEVLAGKEVADRYRAAFAGYGLAPGETPADEAAARVAGSPVRVRLLAALEVCQRRAAFTEFREWFRDVLRSIDPAPYRDAVRAAVGDRDRTVELVGRPEALAQPPGFTAAVGQSMFVPAERKRAVLLAALRARPGDLALLMELGNTYPTDRRDGADERLRWFQAAVAARPGYATAHTNLGRALRDQGKLPEALACFRRATELTPDDPWVHANVGWVLHRMGDHAAGVRAYEKVVALAPKSPKFRTELGVILAATGDLDGAIAHHQAALRLNPKSAQAHTNLGLALQAKGNPDAAIASFRAAIEHDPGYAYAHYNLGEVFRVRKDFDGAIASYRQAIEHNPGYVWALTHLGLVLRAKGDVDGAIASYRQAIKHDPGYAMAHNNLGVALYVRNDFDGAAACFRDAIERDPGYAPAHFNLGNALRARKDFDGAAAAYREATRLDPTLAAAHNGLGNALRDAGDAGGAAACYREAIHRDPRAANAHNSLAWLLAAGPDGVRGGKQAILYAARACELTGGKDAGCIATLAAAYAEAGDFARAVEFQKLALDFPGAGPGLRERLALYERKRPYRDPTLAPREPAPPPRPVKP